MPDPDVFKGGPLDGAAFVDCFRYPNGGLSLDVPGWLFQISSIAAAESPSKMGVHLYRVEEENTAPEFYRTVTLRDLILEGAHSLWAQDQEPTDAP